MNRFTRHTSYPWLVGTLLVLVLGFVPNALASTSTVHASDPTPLPTATPNGYGGQGDPDNM
jgi:hypothetical protein